MPESQRANGNVNGSVKIFKCQLCGQKIEGAEYFLHLQEEGIRLQLAILQKMEVIREWLVEYREFMNGDEPPETLDEYNKRMSRVEGKVLDVKYSSIDDTIPIVKAKIGVEKITPEEEKELDEFFAAHPELEEQDLPEKSDDATLQDDD